MASADVPPTRHHALICALLFGAAREVVLNKPPLERSIVRPLISTAAVRCCPAHNPPCEDTCHLSADHQLVLLAAYEVLLHVQRVKLGAQLLIAAVFRYAWQSSCALLRADSWRVCDQKNTACQPS